jgi:ABC-2 type transport system permease protein
MSHAPAAAVRKEQVWDEELPTPAAPSSRLLAMWSLYVLTFRQHLHGRRWMVMGLLLSLPIGLAILIRATSDVAPSLGLEFMLVYLLIPQALLPIVALVYAAGIIRDEQEEQTLTYLLIRPIPRWAIYSLKLLATLTATVILVSVFTAFTFFAIYVGRHEPISESCMRCLKAIAVHDLAVIAYCCLFGLVSLYTSRALVFGIVYTAIFEGLIANLPFGVRMITVIYYCRSISYQWLPFKMPEQQGYTEDLAADFWKLDPKKMSEMISIPTCVAVLLGASFAFAVMGSLMCARREFHVKTPEGN